MAEIKMSYIFIEKNQHESKKLNEILLEIIDNVAQVRDDISIKVCNVDIDYRIIQKKNSKRCFMELTSKTRITQSIPALQIVDEAIFKSGQQKYYHAIRDYDGISENFCKKLYPKYAEFERQLRSLILFILTKAYGSKWQIKTIPKEVLSALKENAHGQLSLNETLENMTLSMLEAYLFDKRHVDYPNIIRKQLSVECLEKLDKEEICEIINGMRPTSLWERHFEKFGSNESWMKKITDVHDTRNKVAHQKTITQEEFIMINRKLNSVNRDLRKAIEGIREENFTEYSVIDILGRFTTMVEDLIKNVAELQSFKDVVVGFNAKVQEMIKPITDIYKNSAQDMLNSIAKTCTTNKLFVQTDMFKGIDAIGKCFSTTKVAANSFGISRLLEDSMQNVAMIQKPFVLPTWETINPTTLCEKQETDLKEGTAEETTES